MIANTINATTSEVRDHYDHVSRLYRWLWGEHIHHGYWEEDEKPAEAQINLIRRLALQAKIPRECDVLDIGCGLGGSSTWLAAELGCQVLGITISPTQKRIAEKRAKRMGLSNQVKFEVRDANVLDLPPQSVDTIWIIECSEHLHDKADFFCKCADILRPGGTLALCAWLAAEDSSLSANPALVDEVCQGMLCPSLGSMSDYQQWIEGAGFHSFKGDDITRHVEKTWHLCEGMLKIPWVRMLVPMMSENTRRFATSFAAIRRAYTENAMAYGMITAIQG